MFDNRLVTSDLIVSWFVTLKPIVISTAKFAVFKAGPSLDTQLCSSKVDDLEHHPSRHCPSGVLFSLPLRRPLTLIAREIDDYALLSRRSAPLLSPLSIHSYSSYDAPRYEDNYDYSTRCVMLTNNLISKIKVKETAKY